MLAKNFNINYLDIENNDRFQESAQYCAARNVANPTDHIISNCLLGHLGLFQNDLMMADQFHHCIVIGFKID